MDHYVDADDVTFVGMQTVFEGYEHNTVEQAKAVAERYELDIPIGHSGEEDERSVIMARYRTGGTPWLIVIDKHGVVRFDDFRMTKDEGVELIDRLRAEPYTEQSVTPLPIERGGQELVGTRLERPRFRGMRSISVDATRPRPNQVTLYRWWTDGCAFCRSSLPSIERLRDRYQDDGLQVIAVYHAKPASNDMSIDRAMKLADTMGYRGVVALDGDWSQLKKAYLDVVEKPGATSISILVDRAGVIRFVHPGPDFFRSRDPQHARQNADYHALEEAIEALLDAEPEGG